METATTTGRVPQSRVLLVAASGAFLAFLDATIVNVAFPSIRASFHGTSIGDLSWVLNAYNIVFAAFLVVFGRLSDLLGRRRTFIAGVALFTLASVACGLAPSVSLLVVARVVQALGAALLVPASMALVVEAYAEDHRAHAIGLWGATAAVAAGLGPPIGGLLVEAGGWRWAFLINLPLGGLALLAARTQTVESRAPGRRRMPDLRGAALLAAALGVVNLGIVRGNDWGWSSPRTLLAFVAGAALIAAFVASSRRHPSPLLDPALLRIRSFAFANAATVLAGFGFFAYLLTNILWLQYVWDYSVLRAGLALVPGALVAAVVAAVLGPVAEKRGYRVVAVPGALVWAAAYTWYRQRTGASPDFLGAWLPGQVLSGIGVGATLPVLGSAAMASVPGGRFATASAVVSSARQLGGVLGIAVLVVVVGTPTPQTVMGVLRDGWLMSIVAFIGVALLSLPLGRTEPISERSEDEHDVPAVHLPDRVISLDAPRGTGLAGVALFAALSPEARGRLENVARRVRLPAGGVLMTEGDRGAGVYVLQSGRLEVLIGGTHVRDLLPGAVLGELSVLTGERRSATVRARRDAVLLKVSGSQFSALLDDDPAAARVVVTQLAQRLRAPAPAAQTRPPRPAVVAVVGVHRGAPELEVAAALQEHLAHRGRVVRLEGVEPDALAQAERAGALVLLAAGAADETWRSFCLRQADQVVLVAAAGSEPPAELEVGSTPNRPDLVLVGPAPAQAVLAQWTAAVDPWQVTLAQGALATALRPLADRLTGRSVGLVLAGGGARAFAHIGVLRELEDNGIAVDRVAGSSVGAILAALYATGMTGADLDRVAYEEFVRRNPFGDYSLPTTSLARGRRMEAAMRRRLGADTLIEGLPRQFQTVSTDLATRTRYVHRRGSLVTAIRASVGLPVLFPPVPDGQRLLVDGGILDNLPVDLLAERDEGPIVAVNVAMGASVRSSAGSSGSRPARVPALGETLLRTMMIGSGGAVAAARAHGAAVITPAPMGVGLLEFHQLDRMVQAGRAAARALLEQTGGDLLSINRAPDPVVVPQPRRAASRPRAVSA